MQASVTVYFNTGFNGVDIPASPTVLASASQQSYPDIYYIREDIDKPSIRIKDSYENLCAVDYCAITTNRGTSYYFAVPSALSKGVTLLTLDLDALLTMGGASNINYISGWQERGHIAKADDELFSNIAAEDWIPSEPLVSKTPVEIKGEGAVATADLDIVISNIDIAGLGDGTDDIEVITGLDGTDAVMYFPHVKAPTSRTVFTTWDYSENQAHRFFIPNTCAYNLNVTTVKEGLSKLYSAGQLQLQGSYQIPKEYLANDPTSGSVGGFMQNLVGYYGTKVLSTMPYEYTESGYTPKNKKCYTTFRDMRITSVASGDEIIKPVYELYQSGDTAPTARVWADPCSTGKPYARFDYIKDSPLQYADCVRGLQWANSQLVMEGASGSLWNALDTAFANRSAESQKAYSTFAREIGMKQTELAVDQTKFSGAVDVLSGLSFGVLGSADVAKPTKQNPTGSSGYTTVNTRGIVGALASGTNTIANLQQMQLSEHLAAGNYALQQRQLEQEINQNNIGLIKSNQVVAPTVSYTPEQNLGLYGYNYFVAYEVRKSLNDLKSEDMYYQRFGYNGLHRPLTQQCFNERDYYCYVQAFDVNLKGNSEFGLRVRSKAISQLNRGVRVWKVLPDASYYELN